eukprot:CAMPEP_0176020004 /NCGR_PEP_ID=MMETSP0120_2-20121206/9679_1 /TAXON_ID=160619 /ORGANISM="Kryptoperidinium foliaceum, Strain CCMP 1326" /LENGTH=249 /DNA_ID=CAMNT_0017353091 /DNA_START=37 /DNA_END=783 /DNA_ORIENTATION=+
MARASARRRILSVFLAGVSLALPSRGQFLSPADCALVLMSAVDQVSDSAYDMIQAAADCALPGLSETACASDISDTMARWFSLASSICAATLLCGNLDNICAVLITKALSQVSCVSEALIASSSDCVTDPFICIYDIISAINGMNGLVGSSLHALQFCNDRGALRNPLADDLLVKHLWSALPAGRKLAAMPELHPGDPQDLDALQDRLRIAAEELQDRVRRLSARRHHGRGAPIVLASARGNASSLVEA